MPLAAGLSLDFLLIAKLIVGYGRIALVCAAALFAVLIGAWFVFPGIHGLRARLAALRQQHTRDA